MAGPNKPLPIPEPYLTSRNKWIVPRSRQILDLMGEYGSKDPHDAETWSNLLQRSPSSESDVAPSTQEGVEYSPEDFSKLLTQEEKNFGFRGDRSYLEERRNESQTNGERWMNAAIHLPFGIALKAAQSVAYTGSWLYDSYQDYFGTGIDPKTRYMGDIVNSLDAADKSLSEWLPQHQRKAYQEGGIWNTITSTEFYTGEVAQGLEFLGAMAVPGKVLQGLNKFGAAGEWGAYGLSVGISAAGEAGFEAKGVYDSIKKDLVGRANPQTGKQFTPEEIESLATDSANRTFNMNLALHGVTNAFQLTQLSKATFTKNIDKIRKEVASGKMTAESYKAGREALKNGSLAAISEGFIEENLQTSVAMFEEDLAKQGLSHTDGTGYLMKWLDGVVGFGKSLTLQEISADQKEQMKAILAGAIIGAPPGAYQGYKEGQQRKEYATQAEKDWNEFQKQYSGLAKNFFDNKGSVYKDFDTEVDELDANGKATGNKIKSKSKINPQTGKAELDLDVARKLFYQTLWDKSVFDRNVAYTMDGNDKLATLNREIALAGLAYSYNSMYTTDSWGGVAEKAIEARLEQGKKEDLTPEEAKELEEMKARVKEYRDLAKSIDKKYFSKDELKGTKEDQNFNTEFKKVMFYQQVKLRALQEMKNEDLTEKEIADIDKVIEDTENFAKSLEENRKDFKERYHNEFNKVSGQVNKITELTAKLNKEEDPDKIRELTQEIEEQKYILEELQHSESEFNPLTITQERKTAKDLRFGSKDNLYYEVGMSYKTEKELDLLLEDVNSLEQTLTEELTSSELPQDGLRAQMEARYAPKAVEEKEQSLKNDFYNKIAQVMTFLSAKNKFLTPEGNQKAQDFLQTLQDKNAEFTAQIKELQDKLANAQTEIDKLESDPDVDVKTAEMQHKASEKILTDLAYAFDGDTQVQDTIAALQDSTKRTNAEVLEVLEAAILSQENQDQVDMIVDAAIKLAGGDIDTMEDLDIKFDLLKTLMIDINAGGTNVIETQQKIAEQLNIQEQATKQLNSVGRDQKSFEAIALKDAAKVEEEFKDKHNRKFWAEKGQKGAKEVDTIMKKDFLNMTLDKVTSENDSYESDPEFYESANLQEIKSTLEVAKRKYSKDPRLVVKYKEKVTQEIDEALDTLEKLIKASKANEGTRGAKLKQFESKETKDTLSIIGVNPDLSVSNQDIFDRIVEVVPNALTILSENKSSNTMLSAAARIVLDLFKMNSSPLQRAALLEVLNMDLEGQKHLLNDELNKQGVTPNPSYYGNPLGQFKGGVMAKAIMVLNQAYQQEEEGKNPLFIFDETANLEELEANIAKSDKISDEHKQEILKLINLHKDYLNKFNALMEVESNELFHKNHELEGKILHEAIAAKNNEVPTSEQLGIIRSFLSKLRRFVDPNKGIQELSKAWTFLQGPAGAGKTKIVLNWVSKLTGVSPDKIYAFSHKKSTSDAIAASTKGKVGSREELMDPQFDLSKFDMIVIDEFPFFSNPEIEQLEKRIADHNVTRKDKPLRVIILGDPGQIRKDRGARIATLVTLPYVNYLDPLTLTYRSNVTPIVNLLKYFRRKTGVVQNVKVQSNVHPGTIFDPKNPTIGVHAGNMPQDLFKALNANKASGRRKVIVVNAQAEKARYTDDTLVKDLMSQLDAKGIPMLQVLTYDEVQGETFQEVYIDVQKSGLDLRGDSFINKRNDLEYNTAMYTALSRAKDYIFVLHTGMSNLQPDITMSTDEAKMERELEHNASIFRQRIADESELISKYIAGYTPASIPVEETKPEDSTEEKEPVEETVEDPFGDIEDEITEDTPEDTPSQEDNEEDETKDDVTQGKGTLPPLPPIREDDEDVHVLYHPQGNNLRDGKDKLPMILPKGTKLPDGSESDGSPLIMVRNKKGQILVLGQVQEKGRLLPKWKQLGIISDKEKAEAPFYKKHVADNERNSDARRYVNFDNDDLSNVISGAITYDVNGKAIIDRSKDSAIIFEGNLVGTNPLRYTFGPEVVQKGFINKALELITKGLGLTSYTYSIKIYIQKEIDSDQEIKASGFKPKKGIPYLVVHDPKSDKTTIGSQFIRLTPRKLNKKDLVDDGFLAPLRTLYDTLQILQSKIGDKRNALGDVAINTIIKKMANDKNEKGDRAFIINKDSDKAEHVQDLYDYKAYLEERSKGYPELSGELITEEQFKAIQEAARVIVPLYYGPKNTVKQYIFNTDLEAAEFAKTLEEQVLVKANTLDDSINSNVYYVKNKKTTKNSGEEFDSESTFEAGFGPAQKVLNDLAKANQSFKFRMEKPVKGKMVMSSKRLLSTTTSAQNYRSMLQQKYKEAYIEENGDIPKDHYKKMKLWANAVFEEQMIKHLGYTQEKLDAIKTDLSTSPITLTDLDEIVGDRAFNENGEHSFADGQNYLALPLSRNHIIKLNKTITKKETQDEIESQMGTRVSNVEGGRVVITAKEGEVITKSRKEEVVILQSPSTQVEEVKQKAEELKNNQTSIDVDNDLVSLRNQVLDKRDEINEYLSKHPEQTDYIRTLQDSDSVEAFKEILTVLNTEEKAELTEETLGVIETTIQEETVDRKPFTIDGNTYSFEGGVYYRDSKRRGKQEIDQDLYEEMESRYNLENPDTPLYFRIGDSLNTGKDLTEAEATKLAKSLMPKLKIDRKNSLKAKLFSFLGIPISNEVELKFLDRFQFDALTKDPKVLGMYHKGVVYMLKDSKGNIKENVVRHELMHKIYWDYLTPKERVAVRRSAERMDSNVINMSSVDFQEWLSNKFMEYRINKGEGFSGRIAQLFSNMKRMFEFIKGNRTELDTMFYIINKGYFNKLGGGIVSTGKYKYSEIKKNFPNSTVFKACTNYVQQSYSKLLDVSNDDPNKKIYTLSEAYYTVRGRINSLSKQIGEQIEDKKLDIEDAKAVKDEILVKNYENKLKELEYEKELLDILTQDKSKNFSIIVHYLFPEGFTKEDWKNLHNITKRDITEVVEIADENLSDTLEGLNLKDVIDDAKHVDSETKQSASVKLMLSSITQEKNGKIVWVNPRLAFAKCLKIMESITFERGSKDNESFIGRLEEAIRQTTGLGKDDDMTNAGVLGHVFNKIKGWNKVATEREYWEFDPKTNRPTVKYSVPNNVFFLNPNTLIVPTDFNDKENYRDKNIHELSLLKDKGKIIMISKSDAVKLLINTSLNKEKNKERDKVRTDLFVENQVQAYATIINDLILNKKVLKNYPQLYTQSGLTLKSLVRESYRAEEARNSIAEFYSLFASMMEEHMMISEYDPKTHSTQYIPAAGLSNSVSIKADIQNGIVTKIAGLADKLGGRNKDAYEEFTSNKEWSQAREKLGDESSHANRVEGVRDFLRYIGVNISVAELNLEDSGKTADDIIYFVEKHLKALGTPIEPRSKKLKATGEYDNLTDEEKAEADTPGEIDVYYIMENEGSFLNRLAKDISNSTEWTRPNSVKDTKKNSVFLFHNSTQANDILITLSKLYTSVFKGGGGIRRLLRVPKHLLHPTFQLGNIFVKGINKIHNTVEHDGLVNIDRDWVTSYTDESKKDWMSRVLNASVIHAINTSRKGSLRYIQWAYTISNKPRLTGVEIDFLDKTKLKEALGVYLIKMANRPPLNGIVKDYDRLSNTNFEVLDKILVIPQGSTREQILSKLIDDSVSNNKLTEYGTGVVDQMYDKLTEMSLEAAKELHKDNFNFDGRFMAAYGRLLTEKKIDKINDSKGLHTVGNDTENYKGDDYAHSVEDIHQAIDMMYKNNYINSYFMNELVAGDFAFFKNALDVVKRMSGAFAPGMKGLVDNVIGMKEKFKVAIITDTLEGEDSIQNSVAKMLHNVSYKQLNETQKIETDKVLKLFGNKYESTDGQGFITPERAEQINKGFGRSFKAGRIFKAAHYEQVEKNYIDADGNTITALVPIMLKYSSVVLSDELVAQHDILRVLRDKMRRQQIEEVVFQSATKIGSPKKPTDSNKILEDNTTFDEVSIYELSNEHFRMQSNPDHVTYESEKGVANPTQLGYMVLLQQHLMKTGSNISNDIHTFTAKVINKGLGKFNEKLSDENGVTSLGKVKNFIISAMTGKGNERYLELLEEGVSFQAPYIVNKALTQIAAKLTKSTVGFRLPGEKLILQTDWGIRIKDKPLEFKQNVDGHLEASVLFPRGILPREIEKAIEEMLKSGKEFFHNSDCLGFRIPSTELHSSVAIRIAGFYDSRGTNAIVAPKELVALHGSDFDVDSLFMLVRSFYTREEASLFGLSTGVPIGFELNDKGKFLLGNTNDFEKRIADLRTLHKDFPDFLKVIDRVEDKFFTNVITERFIEMAVHPDNRTRMVTPINMAMFNGSDKDSVFTLLSDLQEERYKSQSNKKILSTDTHDISKIFTLIKTEFNETNHTLFSPKMRELEYLRLGIGHLYKKYNLESQVDINKESTLNVLQELLKEGGFSELFSGAKDLIKSGDKTNIQLAEDLIMGVISESKEEKFTEEERYKSQNKKSVISKNDKIIWGHPALGKTTALEKDPNLFIDWDVEFNTKRDKWIEEKSGTIKGTPEYKTARNEYLVNYANHTDFIEFVTEEWSKAKQKAKQENKKLLASPHMLLNLFPNDFDKIINLSDEIFMERAVKRSNGDEVNSKLWKEGINKTLENVDKSKIITTDKYLDELLGDKEYTEEEIKEARAIQRKADLSSWFSNYEVFKSSMDSRSLVGVFANGFKSLAYMLNSGRNVDVVEENKVKKSIEVTEKQIKDLTKELSKIDPKDNPVTFEEKTAEKADLEVQLNDLTRELLKQQAREKSENKSRAPFVTKAPINLLGLSFNRLTEFHVDEQGNKTDVPTWLTLDALINAAIDNVKEQILPGINASGLTSNAIVALTGLGVPIKTTVLMMRQSAIEQMNSVGFKGTEIANKKKALVELFDKFKNEFDSEATSEEILKSLASQLTLTQEELERGFIEDVIDFKAASKGSSEQVLANVKNPVKSLIRQYAILQEFEKAVEIGEDIAVMSSALNVVRQNPHDKEGFSNTQDKWNKIFKFDPVTGKREMNENFSFDIPHLFDYHPHVKAALSCFDRLVSLTEGVFLKHNPKITTLAKDILSKLGIKGSNENIETIKDDFIKFVITSIPSMDSIPFRNSEEFKGVKGVKKITTGPEAWSQQFTFKIRALKDYCTINGIPNAFLENIAVRTGGNRMNYVQFTAGNNLKYEDILGFQEAFDVLNEFEVSINKQGKPVVRYLDVPSTEYNELQKDFVRYAILNFGLQFGATNYSNSLPARIVKPFVDELEAELNEVLSEENINDYADIFEIEVALHRSGMIGKMPRGTQIIKTENAHGQVRSAGYNKEHDTFFNLQLKKGIQELKKYIVLGTGVFRKTLTSATGTSSQFFVKIGDTGRRLNYFVRKAYLGNYNIEEVFGSGILARSVDNLEENKVNIPDNYAVEIETKDSPGTILLLHAHDDRARLDRRYVMVTKQLSEPKAATYGSILEAKYEVRELTKEELDDYLFAKGDIFSLRKNTSKLEANFKGSNSVLGSIPVNRTQDIKEILKDISKNGSTSGKLMANMLLSATFEGVIDGINLRTGKQFTKIVKGKKVTIAGYWSPGKVDEIFVGVTDLQNKRLSTEEIEKTFFHELMHAVTVNNLTRPEADLNSEQKRAKANLIKLYNLVQEKLKEDGVEFTPGEAGTYYGFKNIKEFISEAFSNPDFQKILDSYTVRAKGNVTFLSKFIDFIKGLLGTVRRDSLLSQVMNNTFYLIDSPTKKVNPNLTEDDITYKLTTEGLSSTTLNILNRRNDVKVDVDSLTGKEKDTYKHTTVVGKTYQRVSDNFTGFISKFISKDPSHKDLSYSQLKAARKFKGVDKDVKLPIDGVEGEMTHEEYANWLESLDEKGRVKGKILHKWIEYLTHNKYSSKTKDQLIEELRSEIAKSDVHDPLKTYGWIEKKGMLDKMFDKLGLNVHKKDIPEHLRDKIFNEVTMYSDTLGYAGTTDMLVEHADGTYSIVDWKTGRSIEKEVMESMLKYGNQFEHMFDDPKTRNHLQATFYAFMMKVENPTTKFRDISLMWIPNEYEALAHDPNMRANNANYLKMIEDYYRTEHPATYAKIKEQSPNAFNPKHYNASNSTLANEMLNKKQGAEQVLRTKQNELKWKIQAKKDKRDYTYEDLKEIKRLTKEIVSFASLEGYNIENWSEDISWGSRWFGQNADVNHPIIELYATKLNEAKDMANAEFMRDRAKFNKLVKPVHEEYLRRNGLTSMLKTLSLGKVDFSKYTDIYAPFYTEIEEYGVKIERLLHKNETEQDKKEAYNSLSDAQKALLDFMNERFASPFKGEDPFLNRTAAKDKPQVVGNVEMNKKDLSDIELFNLSKNKLDQFNYYEGFLPIVAPTNQDIRERYKGSKLEYLRYIVNKYTTYSVEYDYEGWGAEDEAIAIKGLGSRTLRANKIYSRNLEHVFDKYMRSMYQKKYGDDVNALARGMQILAAAETKEGDKSNIVQYLDEHISMELYHKTQEPYDVTKKPILSPFGGQRARKVSLLKLLQAARYSTGAALMWLKPHKALQNSLIAGIFTIKEGAMNSFIKSGFGEKVVGMDSSVVDFSMSDLSMAAKDVATFVGHQITGDYHKSKLWWLSEELRFKTNAHELATNSSYLVTMKETLLSSDFAYMMHSLPEEMIANIIMVAQLRRMKFTSGSMKGQSMWDAYDVKQNAVSGEYQLEYNGPIRGYKKEGEKLVAIKGIDSKEAEKMRYVYTRIHGGYRSGEKTSIEFYALGQAMIQFKKHLPGLLKANFGSKGESNALGFYKVDLGDDNKPLTITDAEGNDVPVLVWQKRITEGRWRTMAGAFLQIPFIHEMVRATVIGNEFLGENRAYDWQNLSPEQKKNIVEGFSMFIAFGALWAAFGRVFGDDEEEDSMKKMWAYVLDTSTQNWNPVDIMKNITTMPNSAAGTRAYKSMSAGSELIWSLLAMTGFSPFGAPDDAYTTNGDVKGWNEFKRGIPLLSSYHEFSKWWDNLDDIENYAKFK